MNIRLPNFIKFGRDICGQLSQAESREWWLTNGLGGYAAGTIAGSLTRRYHGLMIVPAHPPLERMLLVAKADATLLSGDQEWPLFTNRWQGGVVDPEGNVQIESFCLDGRMPVWQYAIGDIRFEGRVWMEPGANTTYLAYRLEPDPLRLTRGLKFNVRVLVNGRDHHREMQAGGLNPIIEAENNTLRVIHSGGLTLSVKPQGGVIEKQHYWVENFDLPMERERGLPDRDNHLCVGHAKLSLRPGEWSGLVFSLSEETSGHLEEAMDRFHAHDAHVLMQAETHVPEMVHAPDWVRQLLLATDSFIIRRPLPDFPEGESVIAGYPWFGDWGRDTMMSLPGLTLATGRYDTARHILETFARFVDRGMLPNLFPGEGQAPEYNTVDAALWYVEAWRAYVEVTNDHTALKKAFPVLQEIMEWYRKGTRYGIHMDSQDSLLFAGEPEVQLTWMDAKVGDRVVTPRTGKPVEVNALWFNAHKVMAMFAEQLGLPHRSYDELAVNIRKGFQRFIDKDTGGLFDVIDGPDGKDNSVRANQILAVSLTYSPLADNTKKSVVSLCNRYLLTSFGLRSLEPYHRDYHPHYRGGVWERDSAYHQGPAWTWLLGHYALAEFKVHGDAAKAQARLEIIGQHLLDAGLGTLSEIFDGAPPHSPRGCPAQAWSVACVLEAWWRLEKAKQKQIGVFS